MHAESFYMSTALKEFAPLLLPLRLIKFDVLVQPGGPSILIGALILNYGNCINRLCLCNQRDWRLCIQPTREKKLLGMIAHFSYYFWSRGNKAESQLGDKPGGCPGISNPCSRWWPPCHCASALQVDIKQWHRWMKSGRKDKHWRNANDWRMSWLKKQNKWETWSSS